MRVVLPSLQDPLLALRIHAGEHNLVVAPSPRPSDLDREAAVHGVAFLCGGVEQDRMGSIAWGNIEGGMVVRLNLFTPSAPYRNCQRKQ